MDGLNLDGLSLMAFSTTDVVEAWKESVRAAERQKLNDPLKMVHRSTKPLQSFTLNVNIHL